MVRLFPSLLACWLASCTTTPEDPGDLAPGCDVETEPRCAHLVDRVMIPLLGARDLAPGDAAPAELCRRLAVDLLGRIPTPAEAQACAGQTPTEAVDAFMATPDYELTERIRWAQLIQVDTAREYYWGHIVDLDELIAQHARGEISYPDFAADAVVHPGFFGPNFGDAWSGAVYRIFLGRPARRDEMDGFRPLLSIFRDRGLIVDGRVRQATCEPMPGEDPPEEFEEEGECLPFAGLEFGANFCGCAYDPLRCTTDVLGTTVDLSTGDCVDDDPSVRIANRGAGDDSSCLDGSDGCPDVYMIEGATAASSGGVVAPLGPMTTAGRQLLRSIGNALADRRDFWEAAVDRELGRYLGWWQLGIKKPDWDVPEVRRVLADELRATGDLRHVQRLILTSQLYVRPADSDPGTATSATEAAPPPWTAGPIKLLSGDAWMYSVATAVGESIGGCDPRTMTRTGDLYVALIMAQVGLVPPPPAATIEEGLAAEELSGNPHPAIGRAMGACTSVLPPRQPNLSLVSTFANVGTTLCAVGSGIVPSDVAASARDDASLDAITRHVFVHALSREPADDELSQQRQDLTACLAAPDGCDDAHAAARWLCQRVIDSSLFSLY